MPSFGAWRADAALIEPGAIIKIRKPPDSKGRATADHWFVVVSPSSEIKPGGIITAIVISSSPRPERLDPERHYPLPHRAGPRGHPDTGLYKPSWACFDWALGVEVFEGDEFDLEIRAQFDSHLTPWWQPRLAWRSSTKSHWRHVFGGHHGMGRARTPEVLIVTKHPGSRDITVGHALRAYVTRSASWARARRISTTPGHAMLCTNTNSPKSLSDVTTTSSSFAAILSTRHRPCAAESPTDRGNRDQGRGSSRPSPH